MNTIKQYGIILFAHGSRDPQWKLPFESLRSRFITAMPTIACELAYLELMDPNFQQVCALLNNRGVTHIRVVPVFLAAGKHLRTDLPHLVDSVLLQYPQLTFEILPPVGEHSLVQDAIVHMAKHTLPTIPTLPSS